MMIKIRNYRMSTFSHILLAVIITYSNPVLGAPKIPNNTISCYRCNNGYIDSPQCANAPHEDKKIPLIKSQGGDCLSISEFFTKFNMITNEFIKRTLKVKGKGKGRSLGANNTLQAYCATITVYATIRKDETPQVYRDCIFGEPENIKKNFKNTFEFDMGTDAKDDFEMPANDSEINTCNSKKVKAEKGTQFVSACLCKADKCNKFKVPGKNTGLELGLSEAFVWLVSFVALESVYCLKIM